MIIGFTGTQIGMNPNQKKRITKWIEEHSSEITEAHHGDCIGADADFHAIVSEHSHIRIIGHIPDKNDKRAYCKFHEEREPKPYLVRNKDIVNESEFLLATPKERTEVLRSGTWSTIRYAKKKIHGIIFFP